MKEKVLKINPKIYNIASLYSAAYVFLDRGFFLFEGDPEKEIEVKITPRDGENADDIGNEFLNELINYNNYSENLKINQDTVKLIIEKALFSASPALMEETEEREINELIKDFEKEDDPEIKDILKEIKS